MFVKNKAAVNALGCSICTALIVSRPLVYPYANGNFGHSRVLYISTRGAFHLFACFDKQGHSYEPQNVERATVQGFTLSLCLYITLFENTRLP